MSATGTIVSTGYNVRGLIGFAQNLTMRESYAQVDVTASYNVGGLVGNLNSGTIEDSYATGNVAGTAAIEGRIGGLGGSNSGTITKSYAAGVVSTVGGQTDDIGIGSPLTTAQMLQEASFTAGGWFFSLPWTNIEFNTYPCLLWQGGVNVPYP